MKKTFTKTDKKGREETWEWEETPEVIEALKNLHDEMRHAKLTKEEKTDV
tara:strand:- start:13666 stop:13815 length:150 start_codon:yes stop_codon:yes gene_type:complete